MSKVTPGGQMLGWNLTASSFLQGLASSQNTFFLGQGSGGLLTPFYGRENQKQMMGRGLQPRSSGFMSVLFL